MPPLLPRPPPPSPPAAGIPSPAWAPSGAATPAPASADPLGSGRGGGGARLRRGAARAWAAPCACQPPHPPPPRALSVCAQAATDWRARRCPPPPHTHTHPAHTQAHKHTPAKNGEATGRAPSVRPHSAANCRNSSTLALAYRAQKRSSLIAVQPDRSVVERRRCCARGGRGAGASREGVRGCTHPLRGGATVAGSCCGGGSRAVGRWRRPSP